ncbi:MAG TPA: anaerobic ribonucleoside-triphosphate reductase activating protein [Nocardiopsis listeri]|uniref:anaerobic ribonucleoside-triphosphate reductase activating protein n=1 Tax=Nocardiopsis listeri TaxID=53440 RepID=UPI001D789D4D|nr:anaerobic ribonucleoside-triphosphate reductase activating protein [Nocardiopsis listeri]HJE59160.1 anaerobic ribonucleoside-triphosphate reductase activating protein [Nocardiopsis listeri]
MNREPMIGLGGWSRLSTCDWPGHLVTTLFCQGCPWRCGYCHNPELLPLTGTGTPIRWERVTDHLRRRRGLLDGVVFSGGEPLIQRGLARAMGQVRSLGFAVGLHTAGAVPARLAALLDEGLVDWVGFDVKAAPGAYARVTGVATASAPAVRSLRLLLDSGVEHQVRTTVDPDSLTDADQDELSRWLESQGVREHVWQRARDPDGSERG